MAYNLRVLAATIWTQGLRSDYRRSYWRALFRMIAACRHSTAKLWLGFTVLLSAHHFVLYSQVVIAHLEAEADLCERVLSSGFRSCQLAPERFV